MQRIFISSTNFNQNTITIDQETYHHLFTVYKLAKNSKLEIIIDQNRCILAIITAIISNGFEINVIDQFSIPKPRKIPITLIQSLPKQDKLTNVCKLCTEVGIHDIYPVITDFCDVTTLSPNKTLRIKKSIESAAKQSKQSHIPTLHPLKSLKDTLSSMSLDNTCCLVAYEASSNSLRETVHKFNNIPLNHHPSQSSSKTKDNLPKSKKSVKPFDHIFIAIGPEGGFSNNDITIFKSFNFNQVSLGQYILRTEHAGFAMINMLDGIGYF